MATNEERWIWCLHCERCYREGETRTEYAPLLGAFEVCHYEACDGGLIGDGWPWDRIREAHPEYPEVPEEGKVYPLY